MIACDICGKEFESLNAVLWHRKQEHPEAYKEKEKTKRINDFAPVPRDGDILAKQKMLEMARLDAELKRIEAGSGGGNSFEMLLKMQNEHHNQIMQLMDRNHTQNMAQLEKQNELNLKIAQLELGIEGEPDILDKVLDYLPDLMQMIKNKPTESPITSINSVLTPANEQKAEKSQMPANAAPADNAAKIADFQAKIRNGEYSPDKAWVVAQEDSPEITKTMTIEQFRGFYKMIADGTIDLQQLAKSRGLT
jgi:anti-sigma28 factor (negative regulator of flagellin synthesis)